MMSSSHPGPAERITVEINRDLEEIVPIFLANRKNDLQTLHDALTSKDFSVIQTLGHRMKGDGGGYGFEKISQLGAAMEIAAKQQDYSTIEQHISQLEDFLSRVAVIYR